jgi:UDP-2-acetamido-2,6-beta-L-arabino-hexul-4-ose reductase
MTAVLVTGAAGFIGANLVEALRRRTDLEVTALDREDGPDALDRAFTTADVVYHLAGVNRPSDDAEFGQVNEGLTRRVVAALERLGRIPKLVFTSSTQAELDNPYGRSKRQAEDVLRAWAGRAGAPLAVYRLPGVFGKWCRPNYNSVVATFCHNCARDLPVTVNDPARSLTLVHVGDVVETFLRHLDGPVPETGFATVEPAFSTTVGALLTMIQAFHDHRTTLLLPDVSDPFTRRLYTTYVSYLPTDGFAYGLQRREDARGALAEFLKAPSLGQIFVSRTHPGITRGNHYHDAKTEKFLILEGDAVIAFRHRVTGETVRYPVAGAEFRVVDIPPGWAHAITNVGDRELIVLFWASEIFDAGSPDTYPGDAGP